MPNEYEGGERQVGAVQRWWRAVLGEVLATALLIILGVGSMLPAGASVPLTDPALGFGFIVTALIQAFGATSGAHMNPAVTLAALIYGLVQPALAALYVVAQLLGAALGFGVLMLVSPMGTCAGVTLPADGVTAPAAMLVEALLTGTLVLAAAGLWAEHDDKRPDRTGSIKLGLTVAGLVYAGGKMTGASLNPARSLAPAVMMGCMRAHWVYWAGPLGGAAAAALLARFVLAPPRPPPAAPDHLPLRDKTAADC